VQLCIIVLIECDLTNVYFFENFKLTKIQAPCLCLNGTKILFENTNVLMMKTIRRFLKDVIRIFSSVPEKRRLIIRAIAEGAPTYRFAQPLTISNSQFGRRAAIAWKSDTVSTSVLHDSHQII